MDSAQFGVFVHVRKQKCGHYWTSRLQDSVIAKAMGTQMYSKVPFLSLFLKCTQNQNGCDSSLTFLRETGGTYIQFMCEEKEIAF